MGDQSSLTQGTMTARSQTRTLDQISKAVGALPLSGGLQDVDRFQVAHWRFIFLRDG